MTTATLNKSFQSIGALTDFFHFPHQGQKSVTMIKKVICITTDKESVNSSSKLLDTLLAIKNKAISTTEDEDIKNVKANLENINKNLLKVNQFFETINNTFDGTDNEIKIDDKNMIKLMENMSEVKKILEYISEFLTFYLMVHKSKIDIKEGNSKKYSITELQSILEIA